MQRQQAPVSGWIRDGVVRGDLCCSMCHSKNINRMVRAGVEHVDVTEYEACKGDGVKARKYRAVMVHLDNKMRWPLIFISVRPWWHSIW
jgi:hypothetical protein